VKLGVRHRGRWYGQVLAPDRTDVRPASTLKCSPRLADTLLNRTPRGRPSGPLGLATVVAYPGERTRSRLFTALLRSRNDAAVALTQRPVVQ